MTDGDRWGPAAPSATARRGQNFTSDTRRSHEGHFHVRVRRAHAASKAPRPGSHSMEMAPKGLGNDTGNTKNRISVFQSCNSRAFQEFYLPTSLGPSRAVSQRNVLRQLALREEKDGVQPTRQQGTKRERSKADYKQSDPMTPFPGSPDWCLLFQGHY